MFGKNILITTVSLSAIIASTSASSQEAIDEIIVTASKRQQTLQEVPIAVSVVGKAEIDDAKIKDIIDLQSLVPSLRVVQLQNSTSTDFFIRGFGNGANNVGVETSVGVFIDGVYRSRTASQLSDLPNLERVEVLRGPQSTLFGKNASAGVISVVTSKPNFDKSGYVEAGLSNYNGREIKGYVTGPLSENIAYSLGGSYSKRDGYVDNIALGTTINDRNRFALRGQLLVEPTDHASIRVIADYDELDEVCCYTPNIIDGPTGAIVQAIGGQVVTDPFSYATALNFDPQNFAKNYGISVDGEFDIGGVKMTSITSYRETENNRDSDVDFTSADILGSNNQELGLQTFTQEIRFASNNDGALNWLIGAFYFNEKVKQTDQIIFGSDFRTYLGALVGDQTLFGTLEALSGHAPGSFFQAGNGSFNSVGQNNESVSLFGQADYDLTSRLTATVGLNFTDDKKKVFVHEVNTAIYSNIDLFTVNSGAIPQAFFGQAFFGLTSLAPTPANIALIEQAMPGTTAAIQAGVTNSINGLGALQFTPGLQAFPNAVEDGRSHDDNLDYSLRLAYELSDTLNVYASYGTGFKATSWNLSRDSRPTMASRDALFPTPGSAPFNLSTGTRFAHPEESEVFEIGLKAKFENGALNITVFDQAIKNFQTQTFIGTAFTLINAEKQSSRGIEVDANWRPIGGLSLTVGGAYIDAQYDEFTNGILGDISGTRVGNVNEFSASFAATYKWNIGDNDAFVRADYQFESEIETEDGGTQNPANVILLANAEGLREVNTFNASAGVSFGNIDVTIWARNMFDDQYIIQNFPTTIQQGSYNGYPSAPRTFGANVRYSF